MYFYVSGYLLLGIARRIKDVFGQINGNYGETRSDPAVKRDFSEHSFKNLVFYDLKFHS